MELPLTAIGLIGLLLAAWTGGALWLMLLARTRLRAAKASRAAVRRLSRMIGDSPAIPLLVRADGKIEGGDRLAAWLGLPQLPGYLSELDGGAAGLEAADLAALREAVLRTQKTATPFRLALIPRGGSRSLQVTGQVADPAIASGGAALLWWFDFTDSNRELAQLRRQTAQVSADFSALVRLIEAAPIPMWFRGDDLRLQLVNSAYVRAVGARDADEVVAGQIELVEPVEGQSAAAFARQALERNAAVERNVTATIGTQRRTLRVSDLPLGGEGVAGYAVDIEDAEEQARALRAFRSAQRSMVDQLSAGVAQFDAERRLTFANQPFLRLFALPPAVLGDRPDFDRLLDLARDAGRLPEVRDFPAWRAELGQWFRARQPVEQAWSLLDGTHLRVVAQPMPDGALVLLAEDRSEQLALSANRDTLLRTRTATFDSLFESLSVFAPDGRVQLWNRSFPEIWGIEPSFLDDHPHIDRLLQQIGQRLARPGQAVALGEVVRAAALDRRRRGGRVVLADGRTLEFAGVPLPDGNALLTVLDVTDSTRAEAALRERNAALEEADAVKTRFLANMSYELRTPLTSIGGFAELLAGGVAGELSETGKEYVGAILSSVERLRQQIESVLDLTQSEAGMLPLAKDEIELLGFATAIVREREGAIAEAGVTLDLRGDRGAGKIIGDRRQLARAIGNILDNAIAATPAGGRILMQLARRKGEAQIVISDNGPGMQPDELARALAGWRSGDDGERGLGLPLARQLIEAHRGRLELQSEPGAGTTATIILP